MVRLGINIVCISIWTVFALSGQRTISEKFDLGIPQDWNQSSNAEDGGWLHGNAEVLRSEYWPINDPPDGTLFIATNDDKCDCDKSEDYLILPKMDFRENTDLIYMDLEYSFRGQTWTDGDGNSFTEHLYLKLSYDGGNSWEEFEELPGDLLIHRVQILPIEDQIDHSTRGTNYDLFRKLISMIYLISSREI